MRLMQRDVPPRSAWALTQAGVHPLLARLYAARGLHDPVELDLGLTQLLPPGQLKGIDAAAEQLAQAIAAQQRFCIVADYDCDGATACAVGVRGLRLLGARHVDYLVPDRVRDGYGLTPPIAERVKALGADWLITVDNGIASHEGVARAHALGLRVLITDHHLPGEGLPLADAIVNPNQPGCPFPSKALAGVGVMFYVLLALRARMRDLGAFAEREQPRLDSLLPLVALGTVADVVKLDANNRRLVAQGLQRIHKGQMPAGVAALLQVASREARTCTAQDFGFAIGPRLNAAGRLADMTMGIACLLTDDAGQALELATALDRINRERRDIEGEMRETALQQVAQAMPGEGPLPPALCVFDPAFHEGVVGIVAAKLKDRHHRPCFVMALSQAEGRGHELKASGRSIPGFHLRDALDLMSKRHPGLLLRFGGHAMAAGCTLALSQLETFRQAFEQVAREWLDPATLERRLWTDGPLPPEHCEPALAHLLAREVWGQGFPPPTFADELEVVSQRQVGQGHLALKLRHQGRAVDGIWFGRTEPLPGRARLAYRLEADTWQGRDRVRFVIEAADEPEGEVAP